MGLRRLTVWIWMLAAVVAGFSSVAAGAEGEARPTVHDRLAPKEGRLFGHVGAGVLIRNDFYDTAGYGLDFGYHFDEQWSTELRAYNLHSGLSASADRLREERSFVPDLRAPDALFVVGGRLSWGYGKVLTPGPFVIHFDPQLAAHAGITLAEERIVPTIQTGLAFLTHWQYGVQIKLDFLASIHFEQRSRGMIPAVGFVPILAIGWSPGAEEAP